MRRPRRVQFRRRPARFARTGEPLAFLWRKTEARARKARHHAGADLHSPPRSAPACSRPWKRTISTSCPAASSTRASSAPMPATSAWMRIRPSPTTCEASGEACPSNEPVAALRSHVQNEREDRRGKLQARLPWGWLPPSLADRGSGTDSMESSAPYASTIGCRLSGPSTAEHMNSASDHPRGSSSPPVIHVDSAAPTLRRSPIPPQRLHPLRPQTAPSIPDVSPARTRSAPWRIHSRHPGPRGLLALDHRRRQDRRRRDTCWTEASAPSTARKQVVIKAGNTGGVDFRLQRKESSLRRATTAKSRPLLLAQAASSRMLRLPPATQ